MLTGFTRLLCYPTGLRSDRSEGVDASRARVLVVDDLDIRRSLQRGLGLAGFDVETAGDGVHANERLRVDPPDAVVLDVRMPSLDGIEIAVSFEPAGRMSRSSCSPPSRTSRTGSVACPRRRRLRRQTLRATRAGAATPRSAEAGSRANVGTATGQRAHRSPSAHRQRGRPATGADPTSSTCWRCSHATADWC
jgi:hypothetical protein